MNTALSQLILQADYDGAIGEECIDYADVPTVDYQQIHVAELPYEPYAPGVARAKALEQSEKERRARYRACVDSLKGCDYSYRMQLELIAQALCDDYVPLTDRPELHQCIERLKSHDPLREIVTR